MLTPYQQGYADRLGGKAGPRRVPAGDASWAEKLYYSGWKAALRDLLHQSN